MAIIVIVDDDPTIQLIAGELLKAEGHAIVHASDGVEALKVLATVPADLVVRPDVVVSEHCDVWRMEAVELRARIVHDRVEGRHRCR